MSIWSALAGHQHRTSAEVKAAKTARRQADIPADKKAIRKAIKAKRSV